jgi:hypothetical protein
MSCVRHALDKKRLGFWVSEFFDFLKGLKDITVSA